MRTHELFGFLGFLGFLLIKLLCCDLGHLASIQGLSKTGPPESSSSPAASCMRLQNVRKSYVNILHVKKKTKLCSPSACFTMFYNFVR